MIKVFTQIDLVRYLYRETSEIETQEINKALLCDSELQLQYKELADQKRQLDDAGLVPSQASTERILNYSRRFQTKG